MPMVEAKCPECGATIGGRNHTSTSGNRRIRGIPTTSPGYIDGDRCDQKSLDSTSKASPMSASTVLVLRLLVNAIFFASVHASPEGLPASSVYQRAVVGYCACWKAAKRQLHVGSCTDLLVVLNLVLVHVDTVPCHLGNSGGRDAFEQKFQVSCMEAIFTPQISKQIDQAKAKHSRAQVQPMLLAAFGSSGYLQITESNEQRDLATLLWRFRQPVSLSHFVVHFDGKAVNAKRCPLTALLIHEDLSLEHAAASVTAIFRWHALLVLAFPSGTLNRSDAASLTNLDVISRIDESQRSQAFTILDKFCVAFNNSFPAVQQILQCQANPFLREIDEQRVVDLSCGGDPEPVGMGRDSPLSFSIPSSSWEDGDARGLCTVRILEGIQTNNNRMIEELNETSGQALAADTPVTLSMETPELVVNGRLVTFSLVEDLAPMARQMAIQSFEYGQGYSLNYDFAAIEQRLVNKLLTGKALVQIRIRMFQFQGEIQVSCLLYFKFLIFSLLTQLIEA